MILVGRGEEEQVACDEDRGRISSLLDRHRSNVLKRVVHQLFQPTEEVLVMPKLVEPKLSCYFKAFIV